MSLDFSLVEKREVDIASLNITGNLCPMWEKAGIYDALYESDGHKAGTILGVLRVGFDKMMENPDEFKKLNAPNGWGTYPQALAFLKTLIDEIKKNPRAIIRISK